MVDLDDRVVRWNAALEQLYGVSRAEATGRPLDEVFDPPFVEAMRAARREHAGRRDAVSRAAGRRAARATARSCSSTPRSCRCARRTAQA